MQTDLSREAKKTFIDQVKVDYPDVGFLILPVKTLTKVEDTLEYLFSSVISLEIKKITAYQPGDVLFMAFGTEQNVVIKFTISLSMILCKLTVAHGDDYYFISLLIRKYWIFATTRS